MVVFLPQQRIFRLVIALSQSKVVFSDSKSLSFEVESDCISVFQFEGEDCGPLEDYLQEEEMPENHVQAALASQKVEEVIKLTP